MDEKMIQKLNTAISVVFIVAAALLFTAALKRRDADTAPAFSEIATNAPEARSAQAYGDLAGMRQIQLAKSFASWTPDAEVEEDKTRTASLAVKGNILKVYLSVKASVEGKPLTKYESVFVKFNDDGGHLFRPRSLETPAEAAATSLLYDLDAMPVLPSVPYDESRTPDTANPAALLKDGRTVKLTAFISSLRPALLDDLTVSYVCAEGSDCSIGLK